LCGSSPTLGGWHAASFQLACRAGRDQSLNQHLGRSVNGASRKKIKCLRKEGTADVPGGQGIVCARPRLTLRHQSSYIGSDRLSGGTDTRQDEFVFDTRTNESTNVDRIDDFNRYYDSLQLNNSVFTNLGGQ
jgi:hypothetical protein